MDSKTIIIGILGLAGIAYLYLYCKGKPQATKTPISTKGPSADAPPLVQVPTDINGNPAPYGTNPDGTAIVQR